ncbi:hypothetical protein [Streptomyces sp. NPDC001927]
MVKTGDGDVWAPLELLAQRVRDELATAGLPVVEPGLAPEISVGALVTVDTWNHPLHGQDPEVVVSWQVSLHLRNTAIEDLKLGLGVTAAIRQSGEAKVAMAAAVIAILSAAGFTAKDHDNDMSPFDVRVLAGPSDVPYRIND